MARYLRRNLAGLLTILRHYPQRLPAVLRDRRAIERTQATGGLVLPLSVGAFRLSGTGDYAQAREVLVQQAYAAPGFLPRPGWTIIDCGANIGFYSIWAASHARSGRLLTVEAAPRTAAVLRQNLAALLPAGMAVQQHVVAVGRQAGVVEFVAPRGHSSMAGAADFIAGIDAGSVRLDEVDRQEVPVEPLDAIVRAAWPDGMSTVDLLKVDVEGMEEECLLGAAETLRRTRRVVFEYHRAALLERCAALLTAAGFRHATGQPAVDLREIGLSFWRRPEPGQ